MGKRERRRRRDEKRLWRKRDDWKESKRDRLRLGVRNGEMEGRERWRLGGETEPERVWKMGREREGEMAETLSDVENGRERDGGGREIWRDMVNGRDGGAQETRRVMENESERWRRAGDTEGYGEWE